MADERKNNKKMKASNQKVSRYLQLVEIKNILS